DEVVPLHLLDLTGLDQLFRLLPVGHVQEVGVFRRAAGLERRTATLNATNVALGAERVGEAPAVGRTLARVGEVLAVGRELEREGVLRLDPPLVAVELPVGQASTILVVELLEG